MGLSSLWIWPLDEELGGSPDQVGLAQDEEGGGASASSNSTRTVCLEDTYVVVARRTALVVISGQFRLFLSN